MHLVFECENCGANLKVRKAAAAREILCPKCGRKTATPAAKTGETTKEPNASGMKKSPAAPSSPKPSASPPQAEGASPEALRAAERRIRALEEELSGEQTLRSRIEQLEAALEKERQATAEAETAAQKAGASEEGRADEVARRAEAEKEKLVERHREELAAMRREIEFLKAHPPAGPREKAPPAAPGPAKAPPSEPEDEVNPDTLIEPLLKQRFGVNLRNAILAHAAILLVASLGFIRGCMGGAEEPEPAVSEAPSPAEAPEETAPAPEVPAATSEEPAPTPREHSSDRPDPRAPAGESARPPTDLERRMEALPEPGEVPEPTALDLDL